jgi:hypothetical protein
VCNKILNDHLFSQNSVFTGFIRKEISEDDEDEEELERNQISFVSSLHDIRFTAAVRKQTITLMSIFFYFSF